MVRCEQFYKKFEKVGNFCEKNPIEAKRIENYIDYRRRNHLDGVEINFNALEPLVKIEGEMVHDMSLVELKQRLKNKLNAKDVSRKLVIEIINSCNNKIDNGDSRKLKNIPDVRDRFNQFEHEIGSISYEVRQLFDKLKQLSGIKTNDEFLNNVLLHYKKD